ncbi:MAG TPA: hypothetical protein DEQ09_05325, partial [Bacteroidales bacterium]|nr:hypothetical protein [Bacteroidales bacterium]
LTPVLIGIFTIIAIIAGSGNGFLPGAQGFLFFFLIIVLSRLFSRALNITVEKTVINIMNQVTGSKLRDRLRSVFEGSMNEASVLVAGLLLVGFGALDFVKLVHFSWLLAIIIISCIIYIIFLYKKYREELLKLDGSTGTKLPGDEEDINEEYDSLSSSALFIDNNYFELITNTQLHDIITENNKMLQVIIKIAEKNHNPDILPLLKYLGSIKLTDPGLREKINSLVREMENTLEKEGFGKRKDIVSTIEGSNNRKLQLQAVLSQQAPPVVTDMMRLMRDQDIEIIRESLFIAGKFRIKELLPEICECLDNHYISRDAYSIIKSFGEEAFSAMSGHYYRSSGNIKVRRLLLRLYAESGNEQAIEFILPALWSVNRFLKRESAIGLARCGYKASSEHREKIFRELKRILGLITWNLAVRDKLKNNNSLLGEAIEEETVWWTEMIFNLLSLIYDSDSLMTIKENLGKKNLGSINCALEMVDIVVGNEVKPQLKAFINDMVPGEKARNLLRFYPGYTDENELLVQGMINMDYNHLGVWVKACALKGLYNMPRPEETDFIVALLFGVNSALREEAFRYLKDNYDDAYSGCSYRLPVTYREQLNKLLNNSNNENQYICDKLKSLSAIFPGIPKNSLVELAEKIEIISSEEISSIDAGKDFIIWPAENVDRNKDDEVFINWDITGHRFNTGEISNVHKYYYMLYIRDIELYLFYNPERSSILERYITSIYE